ncbi:hypothetical protein EVAR_98559_1 [Eumeta japonica]|uniref:Uncharacterized protein n=1 Tax=Eumeta variegata TaxID=151549 RepID=A0A4C1YM78_EUMVA|nr:hypothetical protein EVAR_98559_1 [Eumeta japonica]
MERSAQSYESYEDQIGGILKKGQIFSTRNRRACVKILMDVSEGRENLSIFTSNLITNESDVKTSVTDIVTVLVAAVVNSLRIPH